MVLGCHSYLRCTCCFELKYQSLANVRHVDFHSVFLLVRNSFTNHLYWFVTAPKLQGIAIFAKSQSDSAIHYMLVFSKYFVQNKWKQPGSREYMINLASGFWHFRFNDKYFVFNTGAITSNLRTVQDRLLTCFCLMNPTFLLLVC